MPGKNPGARILRDLLVSSIDQSQRKCQSDLQCSIGLRVRVMLRAESLSSDRETQLRKAFNEFDKDGNGTISVGQCFPVASHPAPI